VRDFSSRPRRALASRRDWALMGAGALCLFASAGLGLEAWGDVRAGRARRDAARAEREATRERIRTLEAELRRDAIVDQAWLTLEAPPPRVVADLAELLPPDVRLASLDLRYGPRLQMEMAVTARRAAAYDLFLERLAGSPRFRDVTPGNANRAGELRAVVKATYQPQDARDAP
jgi:hypothetical protein